MIIFTCTLAVAVAVVGSVTVPGVKTTENYSHSTILDKDQKYLLFWKYNDTHVTFEAHVKTTGFVGFGISNTGDMYPGDVVVGWISANGTTHFAVSISLVQSDPIASQGYQVHFISHVRKEKSGLSPIDL